MLSHLVTLLFYSFVGCSLFFGFVNLILSNIYDIRQSRLRRELIKHPYTRQFRRRPLVSVIIYADNNSNHLGDCLSALASSSYKNLEIIVADNASQDETPKLARSFIKERPKIKIRLVAKRIKSTRNQAISQAAKYATGEIIAILDANCVPSHRAIKYGVVGMLQTKKEVILLNTKASHDYTMMGLADSLKSILSGRAKKANSLITPGLDAYNYAAIYTNKAFILAKKSAQGLDNLNALRRLGLPTTYESLATVEVHGTKTNFDIGNIASGHKILSIVHAGRNILSALEPFLIGFMVYVALKFNNPGYLVLAWVSFTSLLTLAIWADESQGLLAKLRLTLLALVAYSLYLTRQLSGYIKPLKTLPKLVH